MCTPWGRVCCFRVLRIATQAQESGGEPSYEERCRAHVEALMAAAAAAEVQTELAARVAGWRAKIGPALAAQDARGEFDIHECAPFPSAPMALATQIAIMGFEAGA